MKGAPLRGWGRAGLHQLATANPLAAVAAELAVVISRGDRAAMA
jgi:hypothetical protein